MANTRTKKYFSLGDRYHYYKDAYESGKIADKNGEVHTLSRVSRLNCGVKATRLLNKINNRSRANYMANKYPTQVSKKKFRNKK